MENHSFFDKPNVKKEIIRVGDGIPFGFERVTNFELGIGGAYGTWGEDYDNFKVRDFASFRMGALLKDEDVMNLSELGFLTKLSTVTGTALEADWAWAKPAAAASATPSR